MKFCLGEIVTSKNEFRTLADEALKSYDLVEVWIDYITDWDLDFINEISKKYGDKLLILTRRNDQNDYNLTFTERLAVLKAGSKFPVYLDLDFVSQKSELDNFNRNSANSKLILSYHNYQATPEIKDLEVILIAMQKYSADLYKIACFCNSRKDLIRLLELKDRYSTEANQLIVLGAGEQGLLSRFACFLDQQAIIYAPRSLNKAIIKGQLSLEQYNLFQEMLNAR